MSNPNIKEFASKGGLARAAKLNEARRKEISQLAYSSRGKHICKLTCKCKICGAKKMTHTRNSGDYPHDFECLLATSSISKLVNNISKSNISLRDFNRSQKKYLNQITADKPLVIVSLGTVYKISLL